MSKENLILVHSFPTNSFLLQGLIDYLNEYVNVYPVDLPGFTQAVPALAKISLDQYTNFVEEYVQNLELESYWLGGVSFGFAVVNGVQPDPRCKGFMAIEPYLDTASLKLHPFKRVFYTGFCRSMVALHLSAFVWSNSLFRKALRNLRKCPVEHLNVVFEQIEGRTFFETAALIFSLQSQGDFKRELPHILIANKDDQTLHYDDTFKRFTENTTRLLVMNTTIEHYPQDPTSAYFKERIPEVAAREIEAFMRNPPPTTSHLGQLDRPTNIELSRAYFIRLSLCP